MTDPTNTLPTPYQSGTLRSCPFCGRNMKYYEQKYTFDWDLHIIHDYDTTKLYIPCPMKFATHIVWKDRISGEVFNENVINRKKQKFIDTWNRKVNE